VTLVACTGGVPRDFETLPSVELRLLEPLVSSTAMRRCNQQATKMHHMREEPKRNTVVHLFASSLLSMIDWSAWGSRSVVASSASLSYSAAAHSVTFHSLPQAHIASSEFHYHTQPPASHTPPNCAAGPTTEREPKSPIHMERAWGSEAREREKGCREEMEEKEHDGVNASNVKSHRFDCLP
jgi:hypothetical protein